MSEINNISNYGYNKIDRIEPNKNIKTKPASESPKEENEAAYTYDSGILGRSQIYGLKGGNIDKSVNEAVEMAENCPMKLNCSEKMFDEMYQKYIDAGLSESDAYIKALMDEDEFLNLASGIKK